MPAGPDADDGDRCGRSRRAGGCGHDPALVPRAVDDRVLDLLDRDRVALADLQHARGLARRRAQAAGELGEVVRRVQLADRVLPAVAVDEVVPVRDQVAQRAAVVAERHAAVHAARALVAQLRRRARDAGTPGSRATRSARVAVGDAVRARSSGSRRARPSLAVPDARAARRRRRRLAATRRPRRRRARPPRRQLGEHALVVGREDLDEAAAAARPSSSSTRRPTGEPVRSHVLVDQRAAARSRRPRRAPRAGRPSPG